MKKITLTILSLLLVATASFAQRSPVQFGFKAGVNFSTLKNNGATADHRTAFHGGVLAHIHLSRSFALQPELLYSAQGAEYSNSRRDKIDYINVPVLAQWMVRGGWRLQTGPQVGFLTSAKSENNNIESSFRSTLKSTDLAWSFGTGYLTPSGLGIDARYNLGLSDISKNSSNLRNRGWQVGLFYQF
jgi:hypothetical protein